VHKPVLLGHISLKVNHLVKDLLVIALQISHIRRHLLLHPRQPVDLRLELCSRLGRRSGERRRVGALLLLLLQVGEVGGGGGCCG
jgi:hypothetical protein